jgi:hypothetical protein
MKNTRHLVYDRKNVLLVEKGIYGAYRHYLLYRIEVSPQRQAKPKPKEVSALGSVEFLFHEDENQDAGTNEGRDMSLSPQTAPALNDDDVAPVRGLSHRESHSGRGKTPFQRSAGN